jgi:hypothetical protein
MNNQRDSVNRKKQIGRLNETLAYIQNMGSTFQTIFEYVGIPSIGKTTLIHMLGGVCEDKKVPYAHVDFDPEKNSHALSYREKPVLLIVDLAAQLDVVRGELLDAMEAHEQSLPTMEREEQEKAQRKLIRAFREKVGHLLAQDPVVFLFDTTDQVHPGVLAFLEEEVISPLTQKGRCIFIFAGRAPIHWRRFEVRRRVRTERLKPFDPESIEDQLEHARIATDDIKQLSNQIYHLTGGLPYGNFVVSRRLKDLVTEGESLDLKTFKGHEPGLLDYLVDKVMEDYVFRGIDERYKEACYVLALVRQFDVIMLRRLLSKFVPAFKDFPRNAYGGLLGKLNSTYLIEWDDTRKGYSVDPTLRRILSQFVRLRHPDRYAAVNREALDVYRSWIERVADYRSIYIVEALYHEACLACVKETCDFTDLLKSFEQYLDQYGDEDPELAGSMLHGLKMELYGNLENGEPGSLGAILPMFIKEELHNRILTRIEEASYQSAKTESVQREA